MKLRIRYRTNSPEAQAIAIAVNQGIDARLEALTGSVFEVNGPVLCCELSLQDMPVLLRRLNESGEFYLSSDLRRMFGVRQTLDCFTNTYIEALLWTETLHPFGTCAVCAQDAILIGSDRPITGSGKSRGLVCADCSKGLNERLYNDEPPAEENYRLTDFSEECLHKIANDCWEFQRANAEWMKLAGCNDSNADTRRAGRDFLLTRNGHGAGFLDGDWPEPVSKQLAESAHAFGQFCIHVGNDGKIYA